MAFHKAKYLPGGTARDALCGEHPDPIMTSGFKAAVFDFDGVLVDSAEAYRQALSEAVAPVAREDWPRLYGMTTAEAVEFASGGTLPQMKVEKVAVEIDRRVGMLLSTGPPAREGALDTLHELQAAGLDLAVASSASRYALDATLDALDWRRLFKVVVGREDVLHPKPFPDSYARAVRDLGVVPHTAFALEDTDIGIRAASGAGLFAIALGGTQSQAELRAADLFFESFQTLRSSAWYRKVAGTS
jgi:HAD superfamily hydrolase (TIGR01509 family)